MFSRRHLPFQIFTLAFVAAMFFPRVLPEGMFPDGLTYSSIARNMAEGRGGFWSPYFSSSFWIPFQGDEYEFYGHPTLAMGMVSLCFRIFGNHWFVEKGFCILIWGISLWLMVRLWQVNAKEKSLWWLPMFGWYVMPVVLWAYPNFILDNTMGVFSLSASLVILRGERSLGFGVSSLTLEPQSLNSKTPNLHFIIAGLLLHLAFLTKGPVGVYPLVLPMIFVFFYKEKISFWTVFIQTFIIGVTCFGTLALWYFYEPARFFWSKYLNVQLVSSIANNDQTGDYSWVDYFYIPQSLILQSLPILGICLILFIFSKTKKLNFSFQKESTRLAYFYLTIALSGSLPMMISHKTAALYMIPCLPFLALSFGVFFEPTMIDWFEKCKISPLKTKNANKAMVFVAVGVAVYCFFQIGKIGREREIINDMNILRGIISDEKKISVCDSVMKDFNYHAYFQRYHRWELAKLSDTTAHFVLKSDKYCHSMELDTIQTFLKKIEIKGLQIFQVYERR